MSFLDRLTLINLPYQNVIQTQCKQVATMRVFEFATGNVKYSYYRRLMSEVIKYSLPSKITFPIADETKTSKLSPVLNSLTNTLC